MKPEPGLDLITADLDKFKNAPCVGRWDLCDARRPYEKTNSAYLRHLSARVLCARCPRDVKKSCREIIESVTVSERGGVWGGKSYEPHPSFL